MSAILLVSLLSVLNFMPNAGAETTLPRYVLLVDHAQVNSGWGRWKDEDIQPKVDELKARIKDRCETYGGALGQVELMAKDVKDSREDYYDVYAAPCFFN